MVLIFARMTVSNLHIVYLKLYNVIYQLRLHKAEGKRIATQLNQSDKGRPSALMKASSCLLKIHHRYIFGEFFLGCF